MFALYVKLSSKYDKLLNENERLKIHISGLKKDLKKSESSVNYSNIQDAEVLTEEDGDFNVR